MIPVASTGRAALALARFRIRLAYRRGGGLLGIVALVFAVWAADELGRRAAGAASAADPEYARAALARGLAGSALALWAIAWPLARARTRSRDDADGILDVQPVRGGVLAGMHAIELGLALMALGALVAAGGHRIALAVGSPVAALFPLAAAPLAAALALAATLRPWPLLIPYALTAAAAGCAAAQPALGLELLRFPLAVPAVAVAGVAALGLAARYAAPRIRAARARGRSPEHARRGGPRTRFAFARVAAWIPRPVLALLVADGAFVARGTHLRGKVAVPILWCVPLAYLIWPIPAKVNGAPLLVAGMLSAFGLAGIGFVLGADLAVAERPYLALRRTAPIAARAAWWSRLAMASAAGAVFAGVLAAAILVRLGPAGLELVAPVAILGIVVPAHAAAIGLAADAANDAATASAIAMSTACVAALVLVAWVAFWPLLGLYPFMMRGTYARACLRWRRVEIA